MSLDFSSWQSIVAFALGVLGIGINFCIFQQKTHRKMLLFKVSTDFVWAIHYLLLTQYSAVAISALALIRGHVFLWQDRHEKESKSFLIVFLIAGALSTWFTWQSPQSILTGVSSILAVVCYWQTRPRVSRLIGIVVCLLMILYDTNLIYNLCVPEMPKPVDLSAIIGEVIGMTGAILGMLRYDRKQTPNIENEERKTK